VLGELQRIAQQIDQHLLQTQRIGLHHGREVGLHIEQQFHRPLTEPAAEDGGQFAQQLFAGARGAGSSVMPPASIFEKSSTSLSRRSSERAAASVLPA
jgi:hypothetical protein